MNAELLECPYCSLMLDNSVFDSHLGECFQNKPENPRSHFQLEQSQHSIPCEYCHQPISFTDFQIHQLKHLEDQGEIIDLEKLAASKNNPNVNKSLYGGRIRSQLQQCQPHTQAKNQLYNDPELYEQYLHKKFNLKQDVVYRPPKSRVNTGLSDQYQKRNPNNQVQSQPYANHNPQMKAPERRSSQNKKEEPVTKAKPIQPRQQAVIKKQKPKTSVYQRQGVVKTRIMMDQLNRDVNQMTDEELYDYFTNIDLQVNKGFHPQQIAMLNSYLYKAKPEEGEDEECQICKNEFEEEEELVAITCLHKYHKECIFQWLEYKKFCPLCLKEVQL